MCDTLGVTNRYTGYRHNLNRANLDPVRLGFAWLDQKPDKPVYPKRTLEPKWTPQTKWTMPAYNCDPVIQCETLNCNPAWSLKKKIETELQQQCYVAPVEPKPHCCVTTQDLPDVKFVKIGCVLMDMPKSGPINLSKSDPPCECDTTFKALPKFTPQFGCESDKHIELHLPSRLRSPPKCEPQSAKASSANKYMPIPMPNSVEKGCRTTSFTPSSQFIPQFECGNAPDTDLSKYIRKPMPGCYIRNEGERKEDLPSWVPQQWDTCLIQQPPICRPGNCCPSQEFLTCLPILLAFLSIWFLFSKYTEYC